jgi:hypothetical protein
MDYDVTFWVTDIAPFYNKPDLITGLFGKPLIMQMPEAMRKPDGGGHFNYMMIYPDGVRLDLTYDPKKRGEGNGRDGESDGDRDSGSDREGDVESYAEPSVILLDKDGGGAVAAAGTEGVDGAAITGAAGAVTARAARVAGAAGAVTTETFDVAATLAAAVRSQSDAVYHIASPTPLDYYSCCNNFWWCLNNVAKGIARDELPYVMSMLNEVVRAELHDMIIWHIGALRGFKLSVGKDGKFFKKYMPPDLYAQYAATYSGSDYADIWDAVAVMSDLFHTLALAVAASFGYSYRQNEEDGIREYMRMVKNHDI